MCILYKILEGPTISSIYMKFLKTLWFGEADPREYRIFAAAVLEIDNLFGFELLVTLTAFGAYDSLFYQYNGLHRRRRRSS